MISVSQVVEDIVKRNPSLGDALGKGIINHSSLARLIKPKIEKTLFKDVQEGSIIVALNRLSKKLKKMETINSKLQYIGDLTVRSNLVDYTFLNSPTLGSAQNKLLERVADDRNVFITISHGISQVTIIASQSLEADIKKVFKNESLICGIENLSSLTIQIPIKATEIPGVLYSILKLLAWEGINLIEVISTFTELTLVMGSKDIDKAFSVLKNLSNLG
jgi:hypothetical protein